VRLSWLAQLFSREKPRPTPIQPSSPRFRAENAGQPRGAAAPARSRLPAEPRRAPSARADAAAPPPAATSGPFDPPTEMAIVPQIVPEVVQPKSSPPRDEEVVRTAATKMPPQEELSIQLNEGMKGLTRLLSTIDERLVQQSRATELVAERLQVLPRVLEGLVEAERRSLETLKDLRASLDDQGKASLQASAKLEQLPSLLDGMGERIHQQTDAAQAVRTSVEAVGHSVRGLVDGSQRAQNSLITEFRRGQDDQRQRLEELVERQRRTLYIVAGIGVAVVISLLILLSRLPG